VRPPPPEIRLADLDRSATGDRREPPRLAVEDEDREEDPDDERR
jgi:hypothetical protein